MSELCVWHDTTNNIYRKKPLLPHYQYILNEQHLEYTNQHRTITQPTTHTPHIPSFWRDLFCQDDADMFGGMQASLSVTENRIELSLGLCSVGICIIIIDIHITCIIITCIIITPHNTPHDWYIYYIYNADIRMNNNKIETRMYISSQAFTSHALSSHAFISYIRMCMCRHAV